MNSEIIQMILSFPFKQIGDLLRWISLSSFLGNVLAWLIYVGICVIPVGLMIKKFIKKTFKVADLMLIVISIGLFFVMYYMINPSTTMLQIYLIDNFDIHKAVLGGFIYSLLIGYIVLILLSKFYKCDEWQTCKWLKILLIILCAFLMFSMVFNAIDTMEKIQKVYEDNSVGIAGKIVVTSAYLGIKYLVSIVPYITTAIVIGFAYTFLDKYSKKGIAKETVSLSDKVYKVATIAVVINVLTNIFYNFIQIVLYGLLLDTYADVDIPIFWLAFILVISLVTKLIVSSNKIKEENEMFV